MCVLVTCFLMESWEFCDLTLFSLHFSGVHPQASANTSQCQCKPRVSGFRSGHLPVSCLWVSDSALSLPGPQTGAAVPLV